MDRANAALAGHLLESGMPVHLVGHEIDRRILDASADDAHVVRGRAACPASRNGCSRAPGGRWRAAVTRRNPLARVVVNGGNCRWPDINWVHALHAAWPVRDDGARVVEPLPEHAA